VIVSLKIAKDSRLHLSREIGERGGDAWVGHHEGGLVRRARYWGSRECKLVLTVACGVLLTLVREFVCSL
jgi:hypothetical protein